MSDPAVKKAATALEFLSQDERERALCEHHLGNSLNEGGQGQRRTATDLG